MGFLDFLFGKKDEKPAEETKESSSAEHVIAAPFDGTMCAASEIADDTFKDQILGPTVAFRPAEGSDYTVRAPFDGTVTQMFKTRHAVTLSSKSGGVEVLIHIGLNTVDLDGEGFTALVEENAEVKCGDPLIRFDAEFLKSKGYELIVPFAVCNEADYAGVTFIEPKDVKAGETVCTVLGKSGE